MVVIKSYFFGMNFGKLYFFENKIEPSMMNLLTHLVKS